MRVSIYGAGQAGSAVAALLRQRDHVVVEGPFGRAKRERALTSGAQVVVIATTSFLRDIADDVRAAITSGSNVLTTAEEAAHPWATDPTLAGELDLLVREHGVTVPGAGLNPGLAFDALVLTVAGASGAVASLRVERTVDLSGFGPAVLRRIGVGHTPEAFAAGVADGTITDHIGFPQSMRLVAAALGVEIERMDREIAPTIEAGETVGFEQCYVAIAGGARGSPRSSPVTPIRRGRPTMRSTWRATRRSTSGSRLASTRRRARPRRGRAGGLADNRRPASGGAIVTIVWYRAGIVTRTECRMGR